MSSAPAPTAAVLPSPVAAEPRVAIVQDGARLHYALPTALRRAGILQRVFTDWFAAEGSLEKRLSGLVGRVRETLGRKMGERACAELTGVDVRRNPWLSIVNRAQRVRFDSHDAYFLWESRQMVRWILAEGFGQSNVLMGFIRNAAPELFAAARARGLFTVGDQMIAPVATEVRELRRQAELWPAWAAGGEDPRTLMQECEERTWAQLDHVTCASEYVRDCLVEEGVPEQRVTVIPYPIDATKFTATDRSRRGGPVTVGFVGAVNLRKGAPYFLQVAKKLDPKRVKFVMVGPHQAPADAIAAMRGDVELTGSVPRSEVIRRLAGFDIFFFPSTCEGSAGAVMEAMASGLPVVTTHNSGSVIADGQDGYVVRGHDVDRFAEVLARLVESPAQRLALGAAARKRANEFNLDWYGSTLASLLRRVLTAKENATA